MSNPLIITILEGIVCISAGYFLFSVIVPFFIVPNLSFVKIQIQRTEKLRGFALKFKSKDKEKTLRNIFEYVVKNFSGKEEKYKVIILPYKTMYYNIEKLLGNREFLHCTIQNRILMTLLINTGQFRGEDFERKLEIAYFGTIHQYLIVKLNGKKIKVDPFFKIFEKIE